MNIVMCFGTFDHLHQGHLNYFQQAKKLGDYLIVVVAREKNTGKKLTYSEEERLAEVKKQKIVDEALLGNLDDKLKIVRKKKPDVLCLGYDQRVDEEKLKKDLAKLNLFPKIIRLKPYQENKYKSSLVKKKANN